MEERPPDSARLPQQRTHSLRRTGTAGTHRHVDGSCRGPGFLINWPIDASHVETVDIYGDSVDLPEVLEQAWVWATMLSAVPALRTLRVRAVAQSTLHAILSALQSPGADTMACPQLETLILVQVSLGGESWDALAGTARLRGPLVGAGGCLAKIVVERPVTKSPLSDDQVLRLNKMTGVEMILTESQ